MEEQKPQIQSPSFHHPLARQSYSESEYDSMPLEDGNVVPMPVQNTITEDESQSYSAVKRKQHRATGGKTRAPGNKKTFQAARQSQSMPHQYADELKRLEDHTQRIHQIIVDRANKDAIRETMPPEIAEASLSNATDAKTSIPSVGRQIDPRSPRTQPPKNQWQSPPPIESQPPETLKVQQSSIHQRLVELGLHLNEAGSLSPLSAPSSHLEGSYDQGQSLAAPIAAPSLPSHSLTQAWESLPGNSWEQELATHAKTKAKTEDFSQRDVPQWDRKTAAHRDFPRDRSRSRASSLPSPLRRYFREWRGRLRDGRSLELPRKPIDRLSDAALWIATSAIIRVGSRYILTTFPILSPVFLILMVAPAIAAVYLIFCVPRVGWLCYYRLFLIMVGFVVGGKL